MSPARDPVSQQRLYALTERFLHAEAAGSFLRPPSITDGLTLDDAYRIGAEIARSRIDRGWRFRGWKVGFTNRRIWSKWGLDQPIVGPVYDETVFGVGACGGAARDVRSVGLDGGAGTGRPRPPVLVPAGRRAALMIEVEVVFGFDRPSPAASFHEAKCKHAIRHVLIARPGATAGTHAVSGHVIRQRAWTRHLNAPCKDLKQNLRASDRIIAMHHSIDQRFPQCLHW